MLVGVRILSYIFLLTITITIIWWSCASCPKTKSHAKCIEHMPDKLLSNPAHNSKGESTVDPSVNLSVRNLGMWALALDDTTKELLTQLEACRRRLSATEECVVAKSIHSILTAGVTCLLK